MTPHQFDALVTDPPAGIGFMGKDWDKDKGGRDQWIAWLSEVLHECYRVMKPGAHGLIWAIPRTSHWTGIAIEDAGFEIVDVVMHLFGSGFPKSQNISKMIDKELGAEREVVGPKIRFGDKKAYAHNPTSQKYGTDNADEEGFRPPETLPATPEAQKWNGWGTHLKPAYEPWFLIRKPTSESSIARNVLKHGTGGLNIDASRLGLEGYGAGGGSKVGSGKGFAENASGIATNGIVQEANPLGRFPANVIFSHADGCECVGTKKVKPANGSGKAGKGANGFRSTYVGGEKDAEGFTGGFVSEDGTETVESWNCVDGCAVRELDLQTSHLHSAGFKKPKTGSNFDGSTSMFGIGDSGTEGERFGDSGGASRFFKVLPPDDSSRFFYVAKPSASEKHAGTEDGNGHPTVKPIKLMEELIRMVTPPGGTVLDPFMGSGTTGIAAIKNDFKFFGIDQEKKYTELAKNRMLGLYSVDEKKLKARKVNPAKQREQQRV